MASLHRARVCMIGTEKDMSRICRILLENYANQEEDDEDLPQASLQEMQKRIVEIAHRDGTEFDTFLYHMISESRFGNAEPGTLRLQIVQQPCGLWTACFAYDSQDAFQTHEWLDLHKRSGMVLTVVQKANWDFGMDKGEVILSAGQILDNWDNMAECWLWLMHQYECGYPPEEAVERLKKLEKTLIREDFDMTVDELLESCANNLKMIAETLQDPQMVRQNLKTALENKDFYAFADLEHMVAESVLWETEHNARWLACIDAVRALWQE